MTHTIQVCIRCNFTKTAEEKDGLRGGTQLYQNLMKKSEKWPSKDHFTIETTRCMGACSAACVVAFQAPGKIAWVFGGLNPRFSIPSLLEFAEKYHASADGMVPYAERPPELAAGLITRLHPVGGPPASMATTDEADCA
ncbi:MAG: DUF1636 domain-containing protein [Rhodospirillaceae bacterium]|nr:DUF1636 domain-containing protein [Rhodospirillaceae bacterium]